MGDWVTYKYIARLKDDTPNDVLNLLECAYKISKENDIKTYDYFKDGKEFLKYLRVFYFDRNEKVVVLFGYSKYFRHKNEIKQFISWINPFLHGHEDDEYQGFVYGSDYSETPPIFIFGDKLEYLEDVQKYHDEERYQINPFCKRIIRLSPERSRALEDLLIYVDYFLEYLKNNSRKKLRTSSQTLNLISMVNDLMTIEDENEKRTSLLKENC